MGNSSSANNSNSASRPIDKPFPIRLEDMKVDPNKRAQFVECFFKRGYAVVTVTEEQLAVLETLYQQGEVIRTK